MTNRNVPWYATSVLMLLSGLAAGICLSLIFLIVSAVDFYFALGMWFSAMMVMAVGFLWIFARTEEFLDWIEPGM